MWTHTNNLKLMAVAAIYTSVALIVTIAFVLRGNNVLAAANSTIEAENVVEIQHASLGQRYQRLALLAAQVIDQDAAAQLLDEAMDVADQYLCEEVDNADAKNVLRVLMKDAVKPTLEVALQDFSDFRIGLETS